MTPALRLLFTECSFYTLAGAGIKDGSMVLVKAVTKKDYESMMRPGSGHLDSFLERENMIQELAWRELEAEDWEQQWEQEKMADRKERGKMRLSNVEAAQEKRRTREAEEVKKELEKIKQLSQMKARKEMKKVKRKECVSVVPSDPDKEYNVEEICKDFEGEQKITSEGAKKNKKSKNKPIISNKTLKEEEIQSLTYIDIKPKSRSPMPDVRTRREEKQSHDFTDSGVKGWQEVTKRSKVPSSALLEVAKLEGENLKVNQVTKPVERKSGGRATWEQKLMEGGGPSRQARCVRQEVKKVQQPAEVSSRSTDLVKKTSSIQTKVCEPGQQYGSRQSQTRREEEAYSVNFPKTSLKSNQNDFQQQSRLNSGAAKHHASNNYKLKQTLAAEARVTGSKQQVAKETPELKPGDEEGRVVWEEEWQTELWLLEMQQGMEERRLTREEKKALYLQYLNLKDSPGPQLVRRQQWSPPPPRYRPRVRQPGI